MKLKLILALCLVIMTVTVITSCQSDAELTFQRYYTSGQVVYQARCQNCHGTKGEGLGAFIPPLTDSVFLKANLHRLPCFIKYGVLESLIVHGKGYAQQMPPQGAFTPIDIAEVLTYVGNSFGNKLGVIEEPGVSADLVKCN